MIYHGQLHLHPDAAGCHPKNRRRSDCWPERCFCFFAGACHITEAVKAGLQALMPRFGAVTKELARSGKCVAPMALLDGALPAT